MTIELKDMVLALDESASLCVQTLKEMGSMNPEVFDHGEYRICASLDPIAGRLVRHVSVSKRGQSVSAMEAAEYAKAIAPHITVWERERTKTATHLYAGVLQ